MKILITGSHGQLGNELKRCLTTMTAEIGPIPAAYQGAHIDAIDYDSLDIANAHAVAQWFKEHGPYDLTINCAAITNVDGCEQNEAAAYHVNAGGPQNLAREIHRSGGKFVHISTDYVFPGTDEAPRKESDLATPISAYGRTKWAGEVLSLAACERTFIVRTAWLFGYVGKNFVKMMLQLARKNGSISVVCDQMGNPTSANDLAYEILKLSLTEEYGVYHCTNEGTCSWFDFASAAIDAAGIDCVKEALTSAQYKERFPQSANRPAYSSLENARLASTIGNEMRPWQEALSTYMANFDELAQG